MTGTTPPAPVIAKARAQEFPSTSSLSRAEVPERKCRTGSMWPFCLTHFLHHTVWHSASKVELPLLGLVLGLGLGSGLGSGLGLRLELGLGLGQLCRNASVRIGVC